MSPESPTEFDRLLVEFRELSDSARMQGNYLEELARHFLVQDATWGSQHEQVWLWQDWPGREGLPDTGIDLVAERTDGGITAIQCKFFAEKHRVQKSDLDSFFEALGRKPFTEGIVIDTTAGDWSGHATEALKNRDKPVRRVGLDQLRHSNIDWSTYELRRPANAPKTFERKQLRAHQFEAVESVAAAIGNVNDDDDRRGKLIMACGTGKTFTALRIAERITSEFHQNASTVLFLVPSIALLQQTLIEWSREHNPDIPLTALAICSDATIGRQNTRDITSVRIDELPIPATTDVNEIIREYDAIERDEGMLVVFSTYQSIDVVRQAQQRGLPAFDLVICDEAHRTTGVTLPGDDESAFVRVHDANFIEASRRLYMTATPRIYNDAVKNAASEQDAVLMSMDDEDLYGPLLYRLSFGEAVEKNLLTDYKVLVLGVSEGQIAGSFQGQLSSSLNELPLTDVTKLVGCWNGLAKRQSGDYAEGFGSDIEPMRRAVAFAADIKSSKRVATEFPALVDEHLSNILNDDPTDDLTVSARHVDGTMSATERTELLDWLKEEPQIDHLGRPVARILTNARCLSEGVDVPSLDAVLFLNPRKSQVDVVQAVGRVMRRAEGKQCGYIILPVAIPAEASVEDALGANERYKVVWQVLQALRSHDERLDAAINQMAISGKAPETILVKTVDLASKQRPPRDPDNIGDAAPEDDDFELRAGTAPRDPAVSLFSSDFDEAWKDGVYAKLVKTVGDRMYWDDWAKDINEIAGRFIALIRAHLDAPGTDLEPFERFTAALAETVNPEISRDEAIELLAQHMITRPIFDAMFPDREFSAENPVSVSLDAVIERFAENAAFERELQPLEDFYGRVTDRIRGLDDVRSKQQILVTLYDKFFSQAFPKLADRMGIVFTPIEVVDYIIQSADVLVRSAFGKSLSDEGVNILDPFVGTGTFMTRLLQSGLIKPEDLGRKYRNELFANEIVLLSYYIAAVNIEAVYREVCTEAGVEPEAGGFPGISLVDTFAMNDRDGQLAGGVFPQNTERVETQRDSDISVIIMNPPYSVGQKSANDDNKNASYPELDARIRETYAAKSTATNKNGLYDSYYRALRWATDRMPGRGVIAFVSNSGFVDGNTAEGVRLTWANEFDDIFVFNLRGNQRTQGELSRKEGGKVFGSGSRTGVAITFLVRRGDTLTPARIHYHDIGDYLTRQEKLARLTRDASIEGTDFRELEPNDAGDWINQRDDRFGSYQEMGTTDDLVGGGIFSTFSRGLATSRDSWCYGSSRSGVGSNMARMIDNYNRFIAGDSSLDNPVDINWNRSLLSDARRGRLHEYRESAIVESIYRPFMKQWAYFDRPLNDMVYRLPSIWPTGDTSNLSISFSTDPRKPISFLLTDALTDLNLTSATQLFPRYTWQPLEADDGAFNLDDLALSDDNEVIVDGYRRVDNITDATLATYREFYASEPGGTELSKDDIFYYVYALLHHPEYRERYEADLKKMLPRIPHCAGFAEYARIGRELADLHVNYEQAPKAPLQLEWSALAPDEPYARYRIGTKKISWTKRTEHTALKYNEYLTITGIPLEADDYMVGGRSPLEWIIDRYYVKTDKASGIVNDPNDWLREHDNPSYVVGLIGSLVTLSLETQRLVAELPAFEVLDDTATENGNPT